LLEEIKWTSCHEREALLSTFDGDNHPLVVGVVDATEQRIRRPKGNDVQREWYSGKKKCHTIKSQIVVDPISGRIIHVVSGYPGKTHDKRLFDRSGVVDLVRDGESMMGDSRKEFSEI